MRMRSLRASIVASCMVLATSGLARRAESYALPSSNLWKHGSTLISPNFSPGDYFGYSVALESDWGVIGAPAAATAHVYRRSGNVFAHDEALSVAQASSFGAAVAVSGNTVLVAAPGDGTNGQDAGAVYVFVYDGANWVQQAKLLPADGAAGDRFGLRVAFSGDTALVSAPNDDDQAEDSGSVYVFVRNGSTWTEQAKLRGTDSAAGDLFGSGLAFSADMAIIGAPEDDAQAEDSGSAYVFVRNGMSWTEQAKLVALDGAQSDRFGGSVAASGDIVLVGAIGAVGKGAGTGASYVFEQSAGVWSQQAKLEANDGLAGDRFGHSVAISGNMAIVGANFRDQSQIFDNGAAYVFLHSAGAWTQEQKVLSPFPATAVYFANDLAVYGDTVFIGAPGPGPNNQGGVVYSFSNETVPLGAACQGPLECGSSICVDGVCCDSLCGGDPDDCLACSVAAGAAIDGTCGPVLAEFTCRPSTGACDSKEVCDGISIACPPDIPIPGCVDTDGDDLADSEELLFGADPYDPDSDQDNVADGSELEWNVDTDKDGSINALDEDSDGDDLPDGVEVFSGRSSPIESDSDGDCAPDGVEDGNRNGVGDPGETDPSVSDYSGPCCNEDEDCGPKTSGRACRTTFQCTDGCRGSNGNGCPPGQTCSSVDDTLGECMPVASENSSSGGGGGNGGSGGGGNDVGSGGDAVAPSNCDCTIAGDGSSTGMWILSACLAYFMRRRRR